MGRSEVMYEAEKKLNEINEDYRKLQHEYANLENSKDEMSRKIEDIENHSKGLESLTTKQKNEYDKLLNEFMDKEEKLTKMMQ